MAHVENKYRYHTAMKDQGHGQYAYKFFTPMGGGLDRYLFCDAADYTEFPA